MTGNRGAFPSPKDLILSDLERYIPHSLPPLPETVFPIIFSSRIQDVPTGINADDTLYGYRVEDGGGYRFSLSSSSSSSSSGKKECV